MQRREAESLLCVLALVVVVAGCGKKQSAPSGEPSSSTTASAAPKWPGVLAAKEGKGWFDVTTAPSGQNGPLSGKTCAHWTLFFEGKTSDGKRRVFVDEWPHDVLVLVVDGKSVDVPPLRIRWEAAPSVTKTYAAADPDLPSKAREMLTAKTWMNAEGPLPAAVEGMERCLAPATKYRAELRKTKEYDLAIAPAE